MHGEYHRDTNVRPIFIIGSYRSGTSATTWALGQHSNIWSIPESFWLTRFCADLNYYYRIGTNYSRAHLTVTGVSEELFLGFWRRALNDFVMMAQECWLKKQYYFIKNSVANEIPENLTLLNSPNAPKLRWVDGTPENSHYVWVLRRVFPEARFIHLIRNPDEVVRSLINFDKIGGTDYTIKSAFETWHRMTFSAYRAELAYGSDIVRRFYHKDLLADQESTLEAILNFIGEEYQAVCCSPLKLNMNSSRSQNEVDYDKSMEDVVECNERSAKKSRELFESLCNDEFFDPNPEIASEYNDRLIEYYAARSRV
ncbi:sulfotransferase [Thermodesulfobacteriota bacterium]